MKNGWSYFVRVRSWDGAVGYAGANGSVMSAAYPILIKKVAPTFIGKGARDLEPLLDEVYWTGSAWRAEPSKDEP